MPFFKDINMIKNSQKSCAHLQVQGQIYEKRPKKRKRACSFTSTGSITIEAAIALTMFISLIVFVLSFVMMINTQFSVQMKMNNIALITAKSRFYIELADKVTDYNDYLNKLKNDIRENKDKLTRSDFWSGIKNAQYKEEATQDGKVDIILKYALKTSVFNKYISVQQRCIVKDWTGKDITKPQNIVYITQNGKVYHVTKECSHLSLTISKAVYSELNSLRNAYGEKYSRCSICVKSKLSDAEKIFITEDGNRYHSSLTCSGLTRNIISVDKDSVGTMPVCSSCGKGK